MPKFNVTLFPVVMVRLPGIEATTAAEAVGIAQKTLEASTTRFSCSEAEWAEQDDSVPYPFKPVVDQLTVDGKDDGSAQDILTDESWAKIQAD